MLINDIHEFVKFLKNQGQNIYHTPEQIDDAINRASLDLFRQEQKKFEESQMITDTLGDFKKTADFTLVTSGVYALPTDYVRLTNIEGIISSDSLIPTIEDSWEYCDSALQNAIPDEEVIDIDVEIDLVDDSSWVSRKRDKVAPPVAEYPICRIVGKTIEIMPTSVRPRVYYLRYPVKAVWAYTTSGRDYVFNQAGSTDLDWSEIAHNEIIEKTVGYLGVALGEQVLMQYEQLQKRNNNEQ